MLKNTPLQRNRFNFMCEAQISYSREHPDQRTLSSEFETVIGLSDEFYQELIAHPAPNDLQAVKVLAASPAVLDLFMWLSYRCFTAKGTESIPLFGAFGLASQIGTTDYSRPRRFRAMIEEWLGAIWALWPDCPAPTLFRWAGDHDQTRGRSSSGSNGLEGHFTPSEVLVQRC